MDDDFARPRSPVDSFDVILGIPWLKKYRATGQLEASFRFE